MRLAPDSSEDLVPDEGPTCEEPEATAPAPARPARASKRVQSERNGRQLVVPPPDFRYVALVPADVQNVGRALVAGATVGAGMALALGQGARGIALLSAGCALSGLGLSLRRRKKGGPSLALVPWGLLVESEVTPRALLWSAVRSVRVHAAHGRDGGNTTTLASFVTVETSGETFFGRTPGEANLERLEAHLRAYADEQATPIALDFDGRLPADVTEADGERLLSMACAWVDTGQAHDRLGLHGATYRKATSRTSTPRAVDALRSVLRLGAPRSSADPRAFAAIVAAEIGATDLVDDLLGLVQSPHPLVAAFAKQAARRLGAPSSRVGSLDEVVPFLHGEDERVIRAWGGDWAPALE